MTPLEDQQFQACLAKVRTFEMSIADLLHRIETMEKKHREHDGLLKSFLDDGK